MYRVLPGVGVSCRGCTDSKKVIVAALKSTPLWGCPAFYLPNLAPNPVEGADPPRRSALWRAAYRQVLHEHTWHCWDSAWGQRLIPAPLSAGCSPRKCGRGVTDTVISRDEAQRIRRCPRLLCLNKQESGAAGQEAVTTGWGGDDLKKFN